MGLWPQQFDANGSWPLFVNLRMDPNHRAAALTVGLYLPRAFMMKVSYTHQVDSLFLESQNILDNAPVVSSHSDVWVHFFLLIKRRRRTLRTVTGDVYPGPVSTHAWPEDTPLLPLLNTCPQGPHRYSQNPQLAQALRSAFLYKLCSFHLYWVCVAVKDPCICSASFTIVINF